MSQGQQLFFRAFAKNKILCIGGVRTIAPEENCPPPSPPPAGKVPPIIAPRIIGPRAIAPKIIKLGQFSQFYKHSETETAQKRTNWVWNNETGLFMLSQQIETDTVYHIKSPENCFQKKVYCQFIQIFSRLVIFSMEFYKAI